MIVKKMGIAFASSALFLASVVPTFATTEVVIENNGAKSDNSVTINNESKVENSQSNTTIAHTNVVTTANTGEVNASYNTGAGVDIKTGNADASTIVEVAGGNNTLVTNGCGCADDLSVTESGNGYKSDNKVKYTNKKTEKNTQTGKTKSVATLKTKANTGKIKSNKNTGVDSVITVDTGDSTSATAVSVVGGSNSNGPSL